tara:strand:- start:535 stop:1896 length:1362 start_codon:yes stop_codon:yes gene_type:complete
MTIRTFIVAAVASLSFAGTGLGDFAFEQQLTASDAVAGDGFGGAVAIDGNTCVIGASGVDPGGSAYIFNRNSDGSWSEAAELAAIGNPYSFGLQVDIEGDTCVIGDRYADSFTGAAHIFSRDASGNWNLIASFNGAGNGAQDFGRNVAVHGDTVLVGAKAEGPDAPGRVYVYKRQNSGVWGLLQMLTGSSGGLCDGYGYGLAIDGDTCVVGSPACGVLPRVAYIYTRQSDGSWSEFQKLFSTEDDNYGWDVDIDGDHIIVGAYSNSSATNGKAYIYSRGSNGSWSQAFIATSEATSPDSFGSNVAISGDAAVVGVVGDDDNGENAGSVYVYQRQLDGSWSEMQKLTAFDGEDFDRFGRVSIFGDTCVIGAAGVDPGGAAYVYRTATPPSDGACCVCTGCSILTEEQCADLGGQYLPGLPCDECPPPCLGDVNGDGQVNVADLLTVIANWNNCP